MRKQTDLDSVDGLALEDSLYCPLSQRCPYAQDLPEEEREHPIRLQTTGDPIMVDEYLTPTVQDAVEGREYRCIAIDSHDGRAQQCAFTQALSLGHTAMRFTYQVARALGEYQD